MQTITASIGTNRYQTTLTNTRHTLTADESETVGGKDEGPNPKEYMMMSLAGCTAITLRMYADKKQWDVTTIDVHVNMEKVNNHTLFTRNIEISGNIDTEQKNRLLDIAKACPVHKILTNPIEIITTLL